MTDLNLIHESGGRFRCATKLDHGIAVEKFKAGERVVARVQKPRSGRQRNWFFAMLHDAHQNQTAGPPFDSAERMRKWCLIKVGHCDTKEFAPNAMTRDMAAWLRQTYTDIDITADNRAIYVHTARSISHEACDHTTMCRVADAVVDLICAELVPGTTRADWEPYLPGVTA